MWTPYIRALLHGHLHFSHDFHKKLNANARCVSKPQFRGKIKGSVLAEM